MKYLTPSGIRLLLILFLAFAQVACTLRKTPSPAPIPSTPNMGQADPSSADTIGEEVSGPGKLEAESVIITFAFHASSRDLFEPLMEAFHRQYPSIQVQFVAWPAFSPGMNFYETLASSADVTLIYGRSPEMAAYFLDLQPMIDTDLSFAPDDFWPGALTACQDVEGRTLGIPLNLFMTGIFYDQEAYAAAGLPYPQPGWTWGDFRQNAVALGKQEGTGIRYGYGDPPYLSVLNPIIGASLSETGGEIDVQGLAARLQWYLDLAQEKVLYPIQGVPGSEASELARDQWEAMFQGGQPPAMWHGRLLDPIPGIAGVSEDTDPATHLAITEYGLAPFPVAADGSLSNSTPLSAQCAAISAGSTHPQAAWAWLNFLTRHRLVGDASQAPERVKIPARPSVAAAEGFWDGLPAGAQEAVHFGLEHAWYSGLYQPAQDAVLAALVKALSGQTDLATALAEAKAKLESNTLVEPGKPEITVATPAPSSNESSGTPVVRFYPGNASPQELTAIGGLVRQFNQTHSSEFTVEVLSGYTSSPNDGYYETLANQFDCFLSETDPVGAARSEVILNLNAWLEKEDPAFQADYNSALLAASSFEGELYSLPLTSQPAILVYNADLLAQRGLQPPTHDGSFVDFVQNLSAIASPEGDAARYGFLPESQAVNSLEFFIAGRNVHWLDDTQEVPAAWLNTPEMASTLTWLEELYRSGALFRSASGEAWWSSIVQAIRSGQIAYWTALAGEQERLYFEDEPPSFKIGIAPLPLLPAPNSLLDASVERGAFISAQSEHPGACWSWIQYLSEQPTAFAGIPARQSLANSEAWEIEVGQSNAAIFRLARERMQQSAEGRRMEMVVMPLAAWLSQAEIETRNGSDPGPALAAAQGKADAYRACLLAVDLFALGEIEIQAKVLECAKQADPNW